jgi:hypothetical protein
MGRIGCWTVGGVAVRTVSGILEGPGSSSSKEQGAVMICRIYGKELNAFMCNLYEVAAMSAGKTRRVNSPGGYCRSGV